LSCFDASRHLTADAALSPGEERSGARPGASVVDLDLVRSADHSFITTANAVAALIGMDAPRRSVPVLQSILLQENHVSIGSGMTRVVQYARPRIRAHPLAVVMTNDPQATSSIYDTRTRPCFQTLSTQGKGGVGVMREASSSSTVSSFRRELRIEFG